MKGPNRVLVARATLIVAARRQLRERSRDAGIRYAPANWGLSQRGWQVHSATQRLFRGHNVLGQCVNYLVLYFESSHPAQERCVAIESKEFGLAIDRRYE